MASLNKVILIGNIGKQPEIKQTATGMKIAKFSVATTESSKKNGEWVNKTDWHNIVFFDKQADYVQDKLNKGMMVYIEGKLITNSWEADGVKKYKTEIIGSMFKNLTKREKTEGQSSGSTQPSDPDSLPF